MQTCKIKLMEKNKLYYTAFVYSFGKKRQMVILCPCKIWVRILSDGFLQFALSPNTAIWNLFSILCEYDKIIFIRINFSVWNKIIWAISDQSTGRPVSCSAACPVLHCFSQAYWNSLYLVNSFHCWIYFLYPCFCL